MSQSSSSSGTSKNKPKLLLRYYTDEGNLEELYIAKGLGLGRNDANAVCLNHESVDPFHAQIVDRQGSFWLCCLQAHGRVEVKGKFVQELELLNETEFRIGQTKFVCFSGRQTVIDPAKTTALDSSQAGCPYCGHPGVPSSETGPVSCPNCQHKVLIINADQGKKFWVPGKFGNYSVERFVACGGMGIVLKGMDNQSRNAVAIKLIRHDLATQKGARERFHQEIDTMSKLDHPNVVKFLDHGKENKFDYFVMEWIDGRTLREIASQGELKGKDLKFKQVAEWFLDVAAAITSMHQLNLVHRDVKPSNILIDQNNRARLADLGLSRPMDEATAGLTTTGNAPGTWQYMSPEQIRAPESVTHKSDYYSIAVTFYELLAGHLPLGAWPKLSTLNDSVPPEFDELLKQILRPKPADRPDSLSATRIAVQKLITPQWSYRYSYGISNYFEFRNLSHFDLNDVVVEARWRNQGGIENSVSIKKKILKAQEVHREPSVFSSDDQFAIVNFEATMQADVGKIGLPDDFNGGKTVLPFTSDSAFWFCMFFGSVVFVAAWFFGAFQFWSLSWVQLAFVFGCLVALAMFIKETAERLITGGYLESDSESASSGEGAADVPDQEINPQVAGYQSRPREIINSIGMKLVLIPKGTFAMGWPRKKATGWFSDEEQLQVTIRMDYYLGAFEVTQAQYEKLMGNNPSWFQGGRIRGDSLNHPVEQVSWEDAIEFCRKLSELPEEKKAGRVYRLPTEAEWEYACRAGSQTAFHFGDDPGLLGDYGWFDGNSGEQTHPVGQKKPNAWGLYDMHGNVWEWCSNWFGDYPKGAVTDSGGPNEGSHRVYRGGSWFNESASCRSAYQGRVNPSFRNYSLGFRVALSPTEIPR
jgi:formylglycine-generating enzyme required for sulfatase activity/serine/threonine protein kinase